MMINPLFLNALYKVNMTKYYSLYLIEYLDLDKISLHERQYTNIWFMCISQLDTIKIHNFKW